MSITQPTWCRDIPHGVRLAVQISAGAKHNQIIGIINNALKIKLNAPAIEGRANKALTRYLASLLNVPQQAIILLRGETNKHKLLEIHAAHLNTQTIHQYLLMTETKNDN